MLKRQSFHQSTANVRTFLGMVLVFSIFQSHKYHKLLPQHLSSAIQPPVAPQATHGKRHLCANIGDLILLKAQHLQGPVAAKSLCKRLRKRNLGNSSASISACDNVCVCQTKPIVNIPVKQNREIPTPFGSLWYELDVLSSSCFPCCRTSDMTKRSHFDQHLIRDPSSPPHQAISLGSVVRNAGVAQVDALHALHRTATLQQLGDRLDLHRKQRHPTKAALNI